MREGRDDDLAGRLEEEWLRGLPTVGAEKTPRSFPIRDLIGALAPILAASGVFLYAILSFAYDAFYSPLGIDPAEVGLDYASILAHSVGFLLIAMGTFIGLVLLLISFDVYLGMTRYLTIIMLQALTKSRPLAVTGARPLYLRRRLDWRRVVLLTIISAGLIWVFFFSPRMDRYADMVKHGDPISPIRVGPVTLLSIRAAPVTLTSARGEQAPQTAALQRNTELLYLGDDRGISIIYDALNQEVLRIPNSSVLMEVSNCETQLSRDSRC